jgi:hypothetical protein
VEAPFYGVTWGRHSVPLSKNMFKNFVMFNDGVKICF